MRITLNNFPHNVNGSQYMKTLPLIIAWYKLQYITLLHSKCIIDNLIHVNKHKKLYLIYYIIFNIPNKQQTTNNKQQTTNNKQQTTNNKQQTLNKDIPFPENI